MSQPKSRHETSFDSTSYSFEKELGRFASGDMVLVGDLFESRRDDDDFGGGETASLHPDISPSGLGSVALGGRFDRHLTHA